MPDERASTLQQIDQARGDLYAIADDLEFLKSANCPAADTEGPGAGGSEHHLLHGGGYNPICLGRVALTDWRLRAISILENFGGSLISGDSR